MREQFGIRAMPSTDHAVRNDGGQQRLDGGKEGNDERRGQQVADPGDADVGQRRHRQARRKRSEARLDRFDRKHQQGDRR